MSRNDDPFYDIDLGDFAKDKRFGGKLSGRHPGSRFQEAIAQGDVPYNDQITADLPTTQGRRVTGESEFDSISIFDDTDIEDDNTSPAALSQVPTSSIFPSRPRTIAAGYSPKTNVMTVVFRDGTWWNYPEVKSLEWQNFKKAYSKGRFLVAHGYQDGSRIGGKGHPADVSAVNIQERTILAMRARAVQVHTGGLQQGQTVAGQKRAIKRSTSYGKGNLGGTGRAKAKRSK